MSNKQLIQIGEILDDSLELSIGDMAERCTIQTTVILEMVQVGVLVPKQREPSQWCFDGYDLLRLRRALRLQKDLDINLSGLALCIDLLEEVADLRTRLRLLKGSL